MKKSLILLIVGVFLLIFLFGDVMEAAYSNWVNSSDLEILNTLPTVTLTAPDDNNWTTNRTPTFTWSGNDADGDSMTYQLNLTCYPTCSVDNRLENESGTSHTIASYLRYLKDDNYYYNWSVRASDDSGVTFGNWSSIRKIEVQSYVLVTLINDTVQFGSLGMSATSNTTYNSPWPFWLQNDGNVELDIDINATSLWNSVLNPSTYYRYKVDNKTGEEGSFDWGESQTTWKNMPNSTQEEGIVNLSWIDATDSAEVDILVTVPSAEGSGNRESLVVFEASLSDGGGCSGSGAMGDTTGSVNNFVTGTANRLYHSLFTADSTGCVSYAHIYFRDQGINIGLSVGLWDSSGNLLAEAYGDTASQDNAQWYNFAITGDPVGVTSSTSYYCGVIQDDTAGRIFLEGNAISSDYNAMTEGTLASFSPPGTEVEATDHVICSWNNAAGDPL